MGWHLIFCAHRRAGGVGETSPGDDSEKAEEDEETLDRGEAIVRRYLRVAGGEKAFRRIRDRTEKFRNIKYSQNGQTTARLAVYMKRGYKFREDWLIENFQINGKELRFVQVYDGDEGWVQMTGTVSPLEGRTLAVFIWDKYLDNFFMQWKQDGYRLSYEGREDADGEAAEVVQMADFTGKHSVRYYFSRANGLIL